MVFDTQFYRDAEELGRLMDALRAETARRERDEFEKNLKSFIKSANTVKTSMDTLSNSFSEVTTCFEELGEALMGGCFAGYEIRDECITYEYEEYVNRVIESEGIYIEEWHGNPDKKDGFDGLDHLIP